VIARLWHGWTTPENADAYQAYVTGEVLPGIERAIESGYHGAYVFRREVEDGFEFATLLLFDSVDAIKQFAGDEYERSYVPPRAQRLLSRYEPTAAHFDLVLEPEAVSHRRV
jgi:hypothetical protein